MASEDTDKILARKDGAVGRLIFNNPDRRNAVSLAMAGRVPEVLAGFAQDDDIRVVVVSGAGGKSFVSGADIAEFEKMRSSPESVEDYERTARAMYEGLREFAKPTVAEIGGYCMGGGMAVACACDLRVCSDVSQFAIPAGRLGIGYRANFTRWVVDAVGPANAKEILITARRYDAGEALAMGLVHRVVPAAELAGFVADYAAAIADNAPLSAVASKGIINEVAKGLGAADLELCDALAKACSDSADYIEGRRAFMEKRKPDFKGR